MGGHLAVTRQVQLGHDVEASRVREATQESAGPTLSSHHRATKSGKGH